MSASALFVDQTAALGGAELCLRDIVLRRAAQGFADRVALFGAGPLADQLRAAGVDVRVAALAPQAAQIRRESGPLAALAAWRAVRSQATWVASLAADCGAVYANTAKALAVAALAAPRARKPLIYHLHDILTAEHFSRVNRRVLVTLANRRTRAVIANSVATAQAFAAAGGRAELVRVIPNGFDLEPFDAAIACRAIHRAAVRTAFNVPLESPAVVLLGRLSPWKGQHVALQAVAQTPGVHLLLAGEALFGEEEYARRLRALAAQWEVADRVHFVGFRPDVLPLLQAVDAVVHCSTSPEPFGRVIVEGMLSQQPVIASRGGGAAEIIDDGVTGLLTPPGDAAALAAAVRRVLGDATWAAQLAACGRTAAQAAYRLDDCVAQTTQAIEHAAHVATAGEPSGGPTAAAD